MPLWHPPGYAPDVGDVLVDCSSLRCGGTRAIAVGLSYMYGERIDDIDCIHRAHVTTVEEGEIDHNYQLGSKHTVSTP